MSNLVPPLLGLLPLTHHVSRITFLMLAAVSAGAGELSLPITVEEPAGIARSGEPVSGGIPLPWGEFKADQPFALFGGAREVPLQALPLVVDERGFLRWILLDFQADLAAKERKTFTLKAAKPSAQPATPLKVAEAADGVTVDTGKVRFTIARDKPFSLFTSAETGGKALLAGGEASYTDGLDGKRYVADKPSSVAVEYAGPLRTTVCVKGRFVGNDQTKFLYIARVTAWAGRSDVHVKYALANSNAEHYTWRRVQDSAIELKLAADASGAMLGASRPVDAELPCWMQQSMRVVTAAAHGEDALGSATWLHKTPGAAGPGGAKAMAGNKELWTSAGKGDISEGWAAARLKTAQPELRPPQTAQPELRPPQTAQPELRPPQTAQPELRPPTGGTLFVTDLYFVEDPPRRLAVGPRSLLLAGIVQPLEGTTSPFCDKPRWLMDCSHLSSQYVLDFAAPADAAALSQKARAARSRLAAMAPPAWYFETESLPVGKFGTQADELACYDAWGWKYDPKQVPTAPAGRIAVMPRWSGGDDNHYTSEQDTLDSLLLMYLRTGRRSFFDAADSWANYFMDLEAWRTDGWRYKDGGVWWTTGGPLGNRPQREKDPVTGLRNGVPGAPWSKQFKAPFTKEAVLDLWFLANAKQCHCHNWGEGLAEWFCLTGDRDALEAAIDTVEQNIDTQRRAFGRTPGKPASFSRDFTRSCYLINATRMVVPSDPFVVEASDYLARVFFERPNREPRGFVNGPQPVGKLDLKKLVGDQGIAEMQRLGVTMDPKTGELADPKTGAKWFPLVEPHTWMFPPLSRAMEVYYRLTKVSERNRGDFLGYFGSDEALDWLIAYGQATAHVLFQPRHGNLSYGRMLVDFPLKGVAKDWASWVLPDDAKNGEGVPINGYLAQFYPDVPARAYAFCGDPFLKQRAYDFWYYGSHRGYNAPKMHNLGGVGRWVNCYSTHDESVCFTGRTFYEWAHPRKDGKPPKAVTDLRVTVEGDKATVAFTAPADEGGGRVARYQLKCSDRPIVSYEAFLKAWAANEDAKVCNWWMAANLAGEPEPKAPGTAESFTVSGIPPGAKHFALCSFDDSSNRSALSNVVTAKLGRAEGGGAGSAAAPFLSVYPPEGVGTSGRQGSKRPAGAVGTAEQGVRFRVVDDLALQGVILQFPVELGGHVAQKEHLHVGAGAGEARPSGPPGVAAGHAQPIGLGHAVGLGQALRGADVHPLELLRGQEVNGVVVAGGVQPALAAEEDRAGEFGPRLFPLLPLFLLFLFRVGPVGWIADQFRQLLLPSRCRAAVDPVDRDGGQRAARGDRVVHLLPLRE